jgi:hypothetical protein
MQTGILIAVLLVLGFGVAAYGFTRARNAVPTPTGIESAQGVRGGYAFTAVGEHRVLSGPRYEADDLRTTEDDFYRVSIALSRPVAPLRIQARAPLGDDKNAGAVATGFSEFDDRFLVHCEDIALVRKVMTPELTRWLIDNRLTARFTEREKDLSGIRLKDGAVSVEGRGTKQVPDDAVDYLVGLAALLPAELVRA